MIVGYEKSAVARGGIGSLLLAARQGDGWVSVGSVGTGFKEKDAVELSDVGQAEGEEANCPTKGEKSGVFSPYPDC